MQSFLRNYATPLTIAIFLGIAVTGLMMFFGVAAGPVHELHEWIGISFVIASVLHIAWNWRGFLLRFSQTRAVRVIAVLVVVLGALVGYKQFVPEQGGHGNGPRQIMAVLSHQPIATVAPALGISSDEAMARLKAGGIAVSAPSQSLDEIASASHAELPRLFGTMMRAAPAPQGD